MVHKHHLRLLGRPLVDFVRSLVFLYWPFLFPLLSILLQAIIRIGFGEMRWDMITFCKIITSFGVLHFLINRNLIFFVYFECYNIQLLNPVGYFPFLWITFELFWQFSFPLCFKCNSNLKEELSKRFWLKVLCPRGMKPKCIRKFSAASFGDNMLLNDI